MPTSREMCYEEGTRVPLTRSGEREAACCSARDLWLKKRDHDEAKQGLRSKSEGGGGWSVRRNVGRKKLRL